MLHCARAGQCSDGRTRFFRQFGLNTLKALCVPVMSNQVLNQSGPWQVSRENLWPVINWWWRHPAGGRRRLANMPGSWSFPTEGGGAMDPGCHTGPRASATALHLCAIHSLTAFFLFLSFHFSLFQQYVLHLHLFYVNYYPRKKSFFNPFLAPSVLTSTCISTSFVFFYSSLHFSSFFLSFFFLPS